MRKDLMASLANGGHSTQMLDTREERMTDNPWLVRVDASIQSAPIFKGLLPYSQHVLEELRYINSHHHSAAIPTSNAKLLGSLVVRGSSVVPEVQD